MPPDTSNPTDSHEQSCRFFSKIEVILVRNLSDSRNHPQNPQMQADGVKPSHRHICKNQCH